jgi:hypothetical protein
MGTPEERLDVAQWQEWVRRRFRRSCRRLKAELLMVELLRDGPMDAQQFNAAVMRRTGCCRQTLRSARRELGVRSQFDQDSPSQWVVTLPVSPPCN